MITRGTPSDSPTVAHERHRCQSRPKILWKARCKQMRNASCAPACIHSAVPRYLIPFDCEQNRCRVGPFEQSPLLRESTKLALRSKPTRPGRSVETRPSLPVPRATGRYRVRSRQTGRTEARCPQRRRAHFGFPVPPRYCRSNPQLLKGT